MSQGSIAIVVEYSVQSLEDSISVKSGNQYPNIYILQKRYSSIRDVSIGEVVKSFPFEFGNFNIDNLIFRFETSIFNNKTGKKIVVFKDIVANDMNVLNKLPCPTYKDKIRIKVLRLPSKVQKKRLPGLNAQNINIIYNQSLRQPPKGAGGTGLVSGLMNNLTGKQQDQASSQPSNFDQMFSDPPQQEQQKPSIPIPSNINVEQAAQVAQEGIQRMGTSVQEAAKNIGGILGGIGAQFIGKQEESRDTSNLNFSDDENESSSYDQYQKEFDKFKAQQQAQAQAQSQQQAYDSYEEPSAPQQPAQPQRQHSVYQNANLFEEEKDVGGGYQQPQYQAPPTQPQSDLFSGMGSAGSSEPVRKQQPPPKPQNSFNIFDESPQNSGDVSYNKKNFATGLDGLDFSEPAPQQQQQFTQPADVTAPEISNTEKVAQYFQKEKDGKDAWYESQLKQGPKIDQWVGGQKQPGSYNAGKKNHIKVLLCSLQNVLWQGNTWTIVGMDKVQDNNQVKKLHRKAIMMVHPDKINEKNADPDKQFVANRVFSALNEAMNEFKKEPGVHI